jgi:hypothetical protein
MPKYQYTAVKMEYVERNPKEYVIPECLDACRILWENNIFTFMCSNNEDQNTTWIALDSLSEENTKNLEQLKKLGVVSIYRGAPTLVIKEEGESARKKLTELVKNFSMQDIPYGYQKIEDFLITKGCYKEIQNSIDEVLMPSKDDYEDGVEGTKKYFKDYDKYMEYVSAPKTIKIYDEAKMSKTVHEYLDEDNIAHLYIENEGRLYDSEYYFGKHKNFLEKQKSI